MNRFKLLTLCTATGLMLAGCTASSRHTGTSGQTAGSSSSTSYAALYGNLTPELQGTFARPADNYNTLAIVNNANIRMYFDDWGRVFYTNNPSRLTPLPAVSLTGSPW